jgi:hypothetical protein
MTIIKQVEIDGSNPVSPMRVSAAGIDTDAAEFNTLIFDGNQSPLRLAGTGWLLIEGMSQNEFSGGQNVRELNTGSPVITPPGTTAIFMVMWRKNDGLNRLYTPSFQASANNLGGGGGGSICANQFIGVCFNTANTISGDPNGRPPPNYTNYAIFKNYN